MTTKSESKNFLQTIDLIIAIPAFIMLVGVIVWAWLDGANIAAKLSAVTTYYATVFGHFYLVLGLILLILSLYLSFSKFGDIKVGKPDSTPEYSDFKYFAILFSSALGAGICIWGLAEPMYIMQESLYGLEANSSAMAEKALSYAFLHWGWIPWAFFAVPGVMYGYYIHSKGIAPRFSMPLRFLVGEKHYDSPIIRFAESLLLMASVAACPIIVINGVNLVTSGLDLALGIDVGLMSKGISCIFICGICFWSSTKNIKRGLEKVSTANIYLCLSICAYIFIVTDPNFIIHLGTTAMGDLLTNFFKMALWSDPTGETGFPQAWTIVYWIWWLVGAFITGMCFANVCKGRTLRQSFIPIIGISPIVAFIWFATWFGGGLSSDLNQGTDYLGLLASMGKEGLGFQFIMDLPLGEIVVLFYILLIAVFCCTSTDAFCLCYAQISTKQSYFESKAGQSVEPPAGTRLIFITLTTLLSFLLMAANIDFNGIQALGAVTTFPCIFLLYVFIYQFVRDLKKDYAETYSKGQYVTSPPTAIVAPTTTNSVIDTAT